MDFGALGIAGLLGLVMVPLVSWLKKEHWDNRVKFFVAVVASAAAGGITVIVNNHVQSPVQFVALWATALAASQAVYRLYFAGTGWEKSLNGA